MSERRATSDEDRELIMVTQRINDMAAGGISTRMIKPGLHAEKWSRDIVDTAMAQRFEGHE